MPRRLRGYVVPVAGAVMLVRGEFVVRLRGCSINAPGRSCRAEWGRASAVVALPKCCLDRCRIDSVNRRSEASCFQSFYTVQQLIEALAEHMQLKCECFLFRAQLLVFLIHMLHAGQCYAADVQR